MTRRLGKAFPVKQDKNVKICCQGLVCIVNTRPCKKNNILSMYFETSLGFKNTGEGLVVASRANY